MTVASEIYGGFEYPSEFSNEGHGLAKIHRVRIESEMIKSYADITRTYTPSKLYVRQNERPKTN